MAMSEPLTPQVLEELRTRLEQKRRRLLAKIEELEHSPDRVLADDTPDDFGDAGKELEDWYTESAQEDELRADLDEVAHALAKFDAGTYGLCEMCGRPIPLARLRVLPEARYDQEHESEAEQRRHQQRGSAT